MDSMRFSNDEATTVPSARSADNREIAAGCGDRGILETPHGIILAYFPRRLRIFPQQIHPPNTHSGKNSMKLRLYIMEGQERGLRLPARRGRIALLHILFDRNPCVLTRIEIGANYEKDRKFLDADCRFGSIRNLSGHSF